MRVAFGTVVYPAALPYLAEMLASVSDQTISSFDVVAILDGVAEAEVRGLWAGEENRLIMAPASDGGIARNRIDLLCLAKRQGYDVLVLGDADDWFSPNRVEASVETLFRGASLAYNVLRFADGSPAFAAPMPSVAREADIVDCNFLGMSNTALNMDTLDASFIESLFACTSDIFDWYLFARVLNLGGFGELVPEATTYYRLHDANIAGRPGTEALRELEVKRKHYELMAPYGRVYSERQALFSGATTEEIERFRKVARFWWDGIGSPICPNGGSREI